jgi:hypothetical protein
MLDDLRLGAAEGLEAEDAAQGLQGGRHGHCRRERRKGEPNYAGLRTVRAENETLGGSNFRDGHPMASNSEIISMALFCDFENIALGVRDAKHAQFDINKVLERLLLKGSIVVKKAYCDWARYKEFKARCTRRLVRVDRDTPCAPVGQELGRHPHGGRCARPLLYQVACRYLRHHQRRFGFFSAGVQTARERQAGDRRRCQGGDLRPAGGQLRRVHFLRRPGARAAGQEAARAAQAGCQGHRLGQNRRVEGRGKARGISSASKPSTSSSKPSRH